MKILIFFVLHFSFIWEFIYLPFLILFSFLSRFSKKKVDIGLGPEPLINNVYHKRALEINGFKSETFVNHVYFITDEFDNVFIFRNRYIHYFLLRILYIDFIWVLFKFKAVYIYFNGCSLQNSILLWRFEPFLFKIANIKTVVMPYGGDIQVLNQTPNLKFKAAVIKDYPKFKLRHNNNVKRIKLWSNNADHVISGCDWVDYMYHWDTLLVGHFSIDIEYINQVVESFVPNYRSLKSNDVFKVLHAPNHRAIKGTDFIISAINELKSDGHKIELILVEKKSNQEILELISTVDLVIDQLIIGWYAMFAIEAMALRKPVICYLREDLLDLYVNSKIIGENEPPIINASTKSIKSVLLKIINGEIDIEMFKNKGYDYVKRIHSLESIGGVFLQINNSIGINPSKII